MPHLNLSSLVIKQADMLLHPAINRFYKQHERGTKIKGDEIGWIVLDELDSIIAVLRLIPDEHFWLRSLVVHPDFRRQGVGQLFLKEVLSKTAQPVVCFCEPHLNIFYMHCGMEESGPTELCRTLYQKWTAYQQKGHSFTVMQKLT